MRTVKCIGDSITEGWSLPDPVTQSYPGLLGYENFGSAGAAVQDFLPEYYGNTLAFQISSRKKTDDTILFLGSNDAPCLTPSFEQDYQKLIDIYKSNTESLFLVLPPKTKDAAYNRRMLKINEIIQKLAKVNDLPVIDLYGSSDDSWLFYDGIHPNEYGQKQIAAIVKSALDEAHQKEV